MSVAEKVVSRHHTSRCREIRKVSIQKENSYEMYYEAYLKQKQEPAQSCIFSVYALIIEKHYRT